MTQEQLSESSGVRRDYIGNLERGAISVPREPDQLRLLATTLGVRLRDLAQPTGWYDEEPAVPGDWEAAIMADPRFNDHTKQALVVILRGMLPPVDD